MHDTFTPIEARVQAPNGGARQPLPIACGKVNALLTKAKGRGGNDEGAGNA